MTRVTVIGVIVLALSPAWAQQQAPALPQAGPVFRTSADVATIDAVVTDSDGKPVTTLTRDDFEVTIAGKRQPLEQAVYIRTEDQPRVLAAARAAASGMGQPTAPAVGSPASQILRASRRSPDDVARTIALVVDDLGLSFRSMYDVRRTVHKYIDTQIAPGDLVAIIRTAGGIGTLQQFTTDTRLLHQAADRLQWHMESRGGLEPAGPAEREREPGGGARDDPTGADALQESMASVGSLGALEFVARGVAALPGRKCIVLFSSGFDQMFDDRFTGSERIWSAMRRMLARANAAGVVINTVDGRGLSAGPLRGPVFANDGDFRTRDGFRDPSIQRVEGTPTLGSGNGVLDAPGHKMGAADTSGGRAFVSSQDSLKFIADQTGGLAIENTNDLNLGLSRILRDQQGYYLLGYTAPPGMPRGGWDQNRVKVRVKPRGLRVRARQGFFGPAEVGAGNETSAPADPLVMAAVSPFASGGMTVRLTSLFGHDATTRAYVRSLLFVDPADIRFDLDAAGRHTARLQVLLLAIGDNGQVAGNWKWDVPLSLTEQTYRRVSERGLVVTVRSELKAPGPYQMRAAVADLSSQMIGSASQFLDVPDVGQGRLALSGLIVRGLAEGDPRPESTSSADAAGGLSDAVLFEPEVRVLPPGTNAVYAYEIYDGLKDDGQPFQASTVLSRDGSVVYQSPFAPLAAGPKSGEQMRVIPIGGQLALGRDMTPGAYTLAVIVRRPGKGKKIIERKQWVDFEIRR